MRRHWQLRRRWSLPAALTAQIVQELRVVSRLARLSGLVHPTLMPQECLDEYLDHIRALPTPLERVNGRLPLLSAWVRAERYEARSRG